MGSELSASITRLDRRELKILEASRELFLEMGYAMTSMDQVAHRARVSKTTLYTRFPSKEQLFFATIRWRCSEHGMVFSPDSFDELPIKDALRAIAHRFLDMLGSPEAIRIEQVVMGESLRFPEVARIFTEAGHLQTIMTVSAFMAHAIERGQLAAWDPTLMARHFLTVIKAHGAGGDPSCPVPMPLGLDSSLDLFLNGALLR
jgi:TetR/AcrR family transcriptional repressor of mexJK operon